MWSRSRYPRVIAPGDVALTAAHEQGGLDLGRHMATEVRDRDDVLTFFDDRGQERGAEQLAYPGHVDGADTRDLAHAAVDDPAEREGAVIDDDVHGRLHTG